MKPRVSVHYLLTKKLEKHEITIKRNKSKQRLVSNTARCEVGKFELG